MDDFAAWQPRLFSLCDAIREETRALLIDAQRRGREADLARTHGVGAGDVTFGLDVPSEERIAHWHAEQAREGPLSVLTEDAGWRHLGPDPSGKPRALEGFDHGGPRIAIDPIDGTRNLMADLRSAWTVVGFAPPGRTQPRLADLSGGIVSEVPNSLAARWRRFTSAPDACLMEESDLAGGGTSDSRLVRVDPDDRPDHGYFPFFRYEPRQRPDIARLEAEFFSRLARHEQADVRSIWDDQYISSGGQLVQLILGRYRLIIDARALIDRAHGVRGVTSKPYDLSGAVVCARAAGAVVTAADGSALDFPIDATTPVGYAGYANEPTRARLEPHWLAVLENGGYRKP